jgi:hypothetical protein
LPASTSHKVKAKKHSKIETLAPVIRDLIDQAVERGDSAAKIAGWLNTEHNVSISAESVRRYMQRFITQHVDQGIQQYRNFLKGLPEKVDAAITLAETITIQKARIGQMLHREKEENKTFLATDKSIEVLRETSVSLIDVELRIGLRKGVAPGSGNLGSSDVDVVNTIKLAMEQLKKKKETKQATNEQQSNSNDGQSAVTPAV